MVQPRILFFALQPGPDCITSPLGDKLEGNKLSETIKKTSQQGREGVQQVRDAVNATVEASARTAREVAGRTDDVLSRTADDAREIGAHVADTVARTADAAVDITQRVAEQQRETLWLGVRAAAGVNSRLADTRYDDSHRAVASAARAMDIYREAAESTAENVQALITSAMHFGRGVQEMQQTWLHLLDQAAKRARRRPQDVLRAKSLEELAEVQRDIYIDTVNYALEASSSMLQLGGRVAQDTARPLQGRTQVART